MPLVEPRTLYLCQVYNCGGKPGNFCGTVYIMGHPQVVPCKLG